MVYLGYVWKDALTLGFDNYYNGEHYDVGQIEFNRLFREDSPYHIIKRECSGCQASHQHIYYRRFTMINTFDVYDSMILWRSTNNILGTDFNLYSSLSDAIANTNAWTSCNYDDVNWEIGAFRDCGPHHLVGCQITSDKDAPVYAQLGDHPCMKDTKFSIYVNSSDATTNPTSDPTNNPTEDPIAG